MKISEIITDKYKLRMPPTVYSDVLNKIRVEIEFEVDHRTNMLCAEDVFAILDKYKTEGEKI